MTVLKQLKYYSYHINFYLDDGNLLYLIFDLNFDEFFKFLSASVIFKLLFVSRFVRRKLMPKLRIYFELAEGFGSQKRWQKFLNETYKRLSGRLFYTDVISKWPFRYIFRQIKDFKKQIFHHLNLPSILYHLLTCGRTCDTVSASNFCRRCSRIGYARDPLWEPVSNSFDNIKVKKDNCSFFFDDMYIDLDIFTSKANDYFKFVSYDITKSCSYHQTIKYCDELVSIFCSHLIRMIISTFSFSVIELFATDSDKLELIQVFISEAINFFCEFLHQFNIEYFYDLFDKLNEFNKSRCFHFQDKPKFGPYIHSTYDITVYSFSF